MQFKKRNVKYIGVFNRVWVYDTKEDKTYMTKVVGMDFMERGKVYSALYDVLNGIEISDDKRYKIFLVEKNIFGFGGTRVKPLYKEAGWKENEDN